ncbi:protein EFR3 homolog B-like [Xenia sp. Carnegie-2017]|uniref:protein EFR3 homolog B-like n=1 Tax=Xenia sp. Carnegie-2017 TaxID=2897299 RepID=UPI001F03B152|nr:protein EFR3 homolog B-like [Xenia sp. Carnegie-2017]
MATQQFCSCFGKLRPKYKRKVDQIFPRDANDGLDKSNMDKLIFYAISSSEKLDRIGAYVAKKLESYVYWRRNDFAVITMEAMEQLLSACHASDINLFVASFLKMVQVLLESDEIALQIRATESFVIYANIEEDIPSYHREYDFFVSKFCELCHRDIESADQNNKIKMAGLRGLQGIFRKTVSDNLQFNIWDEAFMGKIMPSLLHVLENGDRPQCFSDQDSSPLENKPFGFAKTILHDIVSEASFGNVRAGIEPVLFHLDSAGLWVPSNFAIQCFKIILYSVQNQYSYLVIQMLLNHLNKHTNSSLEMKTNLVEVISSSVAIASAESMGASILEVFNTLLQHLRISVDAHGERSSSQEAFEQAIIKTVGAFAKVLPDYQKSEIMMFIVAKLQLGIENLDVYSDQTSQLMQNDIHKESLQEMYLLCLLKVARVYDSKELSRTFPDTLLDALLKVTVSRNIRISKLSHEVLQTLLDRHDNLLKLSVESLSKTIEENDIIVKESNKTDSVFFQKKKDGLFWHIYESFSNPSNSRENILVLYKTLVLLAIEINDHETLIEIIRFVLSLQLVNEESTLTPVKAAIHAVVCCLLNFIAELMDLSNLKEVIATCIKLRKENKFLLPQYAFSEAEVEFSTQELPISLLISSQDVSKALMEDGFEINLLSSPYIPQPVSELPIRQLYERTQSLRSETGSVSSAEGATITEEVTFELLKEVLYTTDGPSIDDEPILTNHSTFNDIAAIADGRSREYNVKIDDVLEVSGLLFEEERFENAPSMSSLPGEDNYEMNFSDKYVY